MKHITLHHPTVKYITPFLLQMDWYVNLKFQVTCLSNNRPWYRYETTFRKL